MKRKKLFSIQTLILGILGIFFIWMIVVIIDSSILREGLLKVMEDKTCELKELGETEEGKKVYSYCFDKVELDKVITKEHMISEKLLIKNLKKKICLWDSYNCIYIAKKYQVIQCDNLEGKDVIIVTDKKFAAEEDWNKICNIGIEAAKK